MSVESPAAVSSEQFLALPEEAGLLRELIDGEIRERPMTTRNPAHAMTVTRFSQTLANWLDDRADWDGVVTTGDVRCRLTRDPDTIVGIDVALFTGPHLIGDLQGLPFLDGPPLIAVEILSPTDTHESVSDKIRRYLNAGTTQVWIADPDFQTVEVFRTSRNPELFNSDQTLSGEPELPGFCVAVSRLFTRKHRSEA